MRGRVADIIICFKFYQYLLRGFQAVRGRNGGLPLTLTVALQQVSTTVLSVIWIVSMVVCSAYCTKMCNNDDFWAGSLLEQKLKLDMKLVRRSNCQCNVSGSYTRVLD